MRVSTTAPLEDNERAILLTGVRTDGSIESRTTWFFFSFPAHPDILIRPQRSRLRLDQGSWLLIWHRPKTGAQITFPVSTEIREWLPWFLETQTEHSGMEYVRRVRAFGNRIGLEGLAPRTLMHDCCYRTLQYLNWDVHAAALATGKSMNVLIGYVKKRKQAESIPLLRQMVG